MEVAEEEDAVLQAVKPSGNSRRIDADEDGAVGEGASNADAMMSMLMKRERMMMTTSQKPGEANQTDHDPGANVLVLSPVSSAACATTRLSDTAQYLKVGNVVVEASAVLGPVDEGIKVSTYSLTLTWRRLTRTTMGVNQSQSLTTLCPCLQAHDGAVLQHPLALSPPNPTGRLIETCSSEQRYAQQNLSDPRR